MQIEITIHDVEVKQQRTFPDNRGFFREVFRSDEPIFQNGNFAQWSHSKMTKNVVKAWHFHHRQTDWWYLALGTAQVVLYDNRSSSPTYQKKMDFLLGEESHLEDSCVVRIPPGVLHGIKVLSEEAHLFYVTSESYDPQDEGRIPYNSLEIPHDWGEGVITVERDRVPHTPPYDRE
ncbi:dTDP-4-dehydrorhamnose 3,5-epimerase family protein [bacterium]|nr:dTDP-4-dehydrorhamnose 3,5-epimerase family protein [bacterium]